MRRADTLACAVVAVGLLARTGEAGERRFEVSVGGGAALGTIDWSASSSWEQHAEEAELQAAHEAGAGPALEATVGVRLSPRFGLRAALGWARRDTDARIQALVPHPFFFDRPRALQARVSGLDYRQWTSHLDFEWRPLVGRLTVALFAGACLARAEVDIVERVEIDEEYPYDEVSFRSAVTRRVRSSTGLGWSAGATVSHALGSRLGLAVQARYTRATVELTLPDREPASLTAGGLHLTVSLGLGL